MNNIEFETGKFPETAIITSIGNLQREPNILFYSSMLFITNTLFAFHKQYYVYSFLFGLLTSSSLMYHWPSDNVMIGHVDKICIVSIVSYGGYMFYNKLLRLPSTEFNDFLATQHYRLRKSPKPNPMTVSMILPMNRKKKTNGLNVNRILCAGTVVGFFCMTLYFYIYGYAIEDYCFHKQKHIGDIYHSLIHLASSIGHHLIMLM